MALAGDSPADLRRPPANGDDERSDISSSTRTPTVIDSERLGEEKIKPVLEVPAGDQMHVTNEDQTNEKSPDASPDDKVDYPKGLPLFFILLALALSIFLASLDMTIVATAIPKITDEFHGLSKVSWYSSAFFMTNGGFQTTWGKAYKYFPLKFAFLASVFVFELGSLICAVAPNSTTLIVGRAFNGLGAAGIGTGAYTIIAFVAEPQRRAMFTGIIGISYGIASVVGPLVGGVFADKVTWRWCFWINLPIGGLAAAIIFFFFHTPSSAKPVSATFLEKLLQMDLIGAFMMMGALISYLLALQYGGQDKPWDTSVVIGLLVGFVIILIVFAAWQLFQGDRAMLPPRLLAVRAILVSALFTFFFSGSFFLTIYYLPIYFQSVDGANPIMSGVMNLPLILSVTIAMILSGIFIGKTGLAVPTQVIGTAVTIIGAGLIYTLNANTSTGKWIGYQILGGVGWGLAFQTPIIIAQGAASAEDMSSTTAIVLLFQCIGGTVFNSAAQSAFVNTMVKSIPATAPGIDPVTVVATGATELRDVFNSHQIPGIITSYMDGLAVAFAIAVGACGVALIVSACNRWTRLSKEAVGNPAPMA